MLLNGFQVRSRLCSSVFSGLVRLVCLATVLLSSRADVVIMSVQLRNTGQKAVRNLHLRVPVPVDTDYQRIRHVVIAPKPLDKERIPSGGKVAFLRFRRLEPGQSAWTFLAVRFEPQEFTPRRGVLTRRLPRKVRERCLGPSHKLDPSSDRVRKRAAEIGPDSDEPVEIVRAFVEHICAAFEYELDDQQDDVDTVLEAGKGSCSELSRVFVALCRARGIPARFASGTRLRDRDVPIYVDTVHHRWVEVFLPRHGWFPVDVSMAVSRADPDRRFGSIPARRLTMLRNAGIANDPLFSSGLTLVEPDDSIERRVRSYWFQSSTRTVGTGLDLADRQRYTDWPSPETRASLLRLRGIHAIPFLAMGLAEPVSQGRLGPFVHALQSHPSRAAVLPLIDLATDRSVVPDSLNDVLVRKTGQRFARGTDWAVWLRVDGLAFLRGAEQQPKS